MVVIFNALQATLSAGIGRYVYELSKAIYESKQADFKIIIRQEDMDKFNFADIKDLIVIKGIKNGISRNLYEQFRLPLLLKRYPDAIVHFPDTMCSFICSNKIILTVHDISFARVQKSFTYKSTIWKKISAHISLKKASHILSVSNFTSNELIDNYRWLNSNNITTIHESFRNLAAEDIDLSNVRQFIYKLIDKKYILTVSTISPRKNIDGLIKAFNTIKDETDLNLIVAGANGWMYDKVYKMVDLLNIGNRVIFTGKVNEDELKYLYKSSGVFVYPSMYEGFGLPPLEAMGFGIPTAVSSVASLPEVTGGASLYFDPSDIKDMKNKIFKIINDESVRKNLILKGNENIKRFSWKKCANKTIEVYKKLDGRK